LCILFRMIPNFLLAFCLLFPEKSCKKIWIRTAYTLSLSIRLRDMRKEPLFETLKDVVYRAATEVNDKIDRRREWGTAHRDTVTPCIDKVDGQIVVGLTFDDRMVFRGEIFKQTNTKSVHYFRGMTGKMIIDELVGYFTDSRIAYMLASDAELLQVCGGKAMVHPDNYLKERELVK